MKGAERKAAALFYASALKTRELFIKNDNLRKKRAKSKIGVDYYYEKR